MDKISRIVRFNLKCGEGGLSDMGREGARLGYFCVVKTFLQRINRNNREKEDSKQNSGNREEDESGLQSNVKKVKN